MLHQQLILSLKLLRICRRCRRICFIWLLFRSNLLKLFFAGKVVNLHFERAYQQLVVHLSLFLDASFAFSIYSFKCYKFLNQLLFESLVFCPLLHIFVFSIFPLRKLGYFIYNEANIGCKEQAHNIHESESHIVLCLNFNPRCKYDHGVRENIYHKQVEPLYPVKTCLVHGRVFQMET